MCIANLSSVAINSVLFRRLYRCKFLKCLSIRLRNSHAASKKHDIRVSSIYATIWYCYIFWVSWFCSFVYSWVKLVFSWINFFCYASKLFSHSLNFHFLKFKSFSHGSNDFIMSWIYFFSWVEFLSSWLVGQTLVYFELVLKTWNHETTTKTSYILYAAALIFCNFHNNLNNFGLPLSWGTAIMF